MAEMLTTTEMKERERRMIEEVWNGRDFDAFHELTSEDYVGHWFSMEGGDVGRSGFRAFIEEIHQGFSDFEMHEEFMFAEDDMIAVGFTTTGTHDGEFFDIPATNSSPEPIPGIMVHRFENGKVAEAWATWDALGMLQDLGLVPAEFHLTEFLETGVNMARQGLMRRTAGDDD